MKTISRRAKVGEKIVITDPQKGWNAHNNDKLGAIMNVNRVHGLGVYTDEMSFAIYINHEGYEVLNETSQ